MGEPWNLAMFHRYSTEFSFTVIDGWSMVTKISIYRVICSPHTMTCSDSCTNFKWILPWISHSVSTGCRWYDAGGKFYTAKHGSWLSATHMLQFRSKSPFIEFKWQCIIIEIMPVIGCFDYCTMAIKCLCIPSQNVIQTERSTDRHVAQQCMLLLCIIPWLCIGLNFCWVEYYGV